MPGSSVMAGIRKLSIRHTQLDGLLGKRVIFNGTELPEDETAPFCSVDDEALRIQTLKMYNYNQHVSLGFCQFCDFFFWLWQPRRRGRTVWSSLCWTWQAIGDGGRAEEVMLSCWLRIGTDGLFKRFTVVSLLEIRGVFWSPNPWHCQC